MSAATLDNDNKLFRRGIRYDFVNMLLHDLKQAQDIEQVQMLQQSTETEVESTKAAQVPTLMISTQILRDVEEMTNFLTTIDTWENEVLDKFLMIKRYISRGHQNKKYKEMFGKLNGILKEIKKLKEEVPDIISIKPVKEASVVGESSNTANQNNDKHVESEIGESSNTNNKKNVKPTELENLLQELDSKHKNCLYSLAIFPENTELKKRLLVHWWIGLGFLSHLGDAISIIDNEEKFSLLENMGILIPKRTRKHNEVVDSYIINPAIHRLLISKYKEKRCILSDDMEEENSLHFYKHDEDDDIKAVLNVNQKTVNSKHISHSPTIKVAQLGMWRYPDRKGHNEINDVTKLNDNIEADETDFLENMAKTVTYLSLKGISRIYHLSESIGNMSDLMVLDLKDCHNLQRLPEKPKPTFRVPLSRDNQWFKELRHLDITGCYLLDHMPKWICELSNLLVLKGAVFNGFIPDQCRLHDISKLQNLIKLSIKIIHSHFFAPEDFSGLASLKNLRILRIVWGIHETIETEMQRRDDVRDNLCIPETRGDVRDDTAGEKRQDVNEDQTAVTRKQRIGNARTKLNIFISRGNKLAGRNKNKILETEKQTKELSFFSFPENLEKLDIICYPDVEAPEMLNAARLKKLKRLYIRGGKLSKIGTGDHGWQVEILRLRYLNFLDLDWYELHSIFPELRCVNYEICRRLRNFPRSRSLWVKKNDGHFPNRDGIFNDDEKILTTTYGQHVSERVQVMITNNSVVPVAENKQKIMVEFKSGDPGLDLVAVLDVSGSMKEKLAKLKTAMIFFIKTLKPSDRLSIVTFSTNVKRHCALWNMTEDSQKELQYMIEDLEANGSANTFDGLLMGLKILKDRRYSTKRATGIILISGSQLTTDFDAAAQVQVGNVVGVHAFGLGKNYNQQKLKSIAINSRGGSFSDIQDMNGLHFELSMCVKKILTAVAEDVTVTISPSSTAIERISVEGGQYQCSNDDDVGSTTVEFGNLYSRDERKVSVDLLLPVVNRQRGHDILQVTYTYRYLGELYEANPIFLCVRRSAEMMTDEQTVVSNACAKIVSTPNVLDDVKKQQLIRYLESLDSQEIYQKLGRVFARALQDAKVHGTQKFTISAPLLLDLCQQVFMSVPPSDSYH